MHAQGAPEAEEVDLVFEAAIKVGPTGRVIGVDMTKEMVDKMK